MPGYMIFEIEVTDQEAYDKYLEVGGPIMAAGGGRLVFASGRIEPLEGGWTPPSIFVTEFPSFEAARKFYYSQEYQDVVGMRQLASKARGILVEAL